MEYAGSISTKSRFAWRTVTLFTIAVSCILAISFIQKHDLIDSQMEGLLQVLIVGCICAILVVNSINTPISQRFRFAIFLTVGAVMGNILLDYTEDIPALNETPLVGRRSSSRRTVESFLTAGWMCGGFGIMYVAMLSIQSWQQESNRRIDELRNSENKLSQSNEKLSAALNELEEAQQQIVQRERLSALGQMSSGVAHDLNNTLSPVVTYTQLLAQSQIDLTDEQKKWLNCIELCALDAVSTIEGLQQFYQRDTRNFSTQKVAFNKLIEQVIDITKPRWKDGPEQSGHSITINTSLSDDAIVQANVAELRSVLTNLIFNAVEAMPDGGTLSLLLSKHDEYAVLTVSDTGKGMSDEAIQKCFEPFYTSKMRGSGLGLSVCHGIIDRHGGTLSVESNGKGTKFIVRLPLSDVPHTIQKNDTPTSPPTDGRRRILLIDDDEDVRQATSTMLSILKTDVVTAVDGLSGIKAFQDQGPFDLVITDLGMAGVDGVEVMRAIRKQNPQQKIVVASGWSEPEVLSRFSDGELPDSVLSKAGITGQLKEILKTL